jgi:hypothetical protein
VGLDSHKWEVCIDVVSASKVVYLDYRHRMERRGYCELKRPLTFSVMYQGKLCINFEAKSPWKVDNGKEQTKIDVSDIWASGQNDVCYRDIIVVDSSYKKRHLELTVTISFKTHESLEYADPREIPISYDLRKGESDSIAAVHTPSRPLGISEPNDSTSGESI